MIRNKRLTILMASIFSIAVLVAIASGVFRVEDRLSFETIAQNDFSDYEQEMPALFIIAGDEDVDILANMLHPRLIRQLRQLDYNQVFAILALQGRKGQGGFKTTVQGIGRLNDQVNVRTEFITPVLGSLNSQIFTSPYHLVVVRKEGRWGQPIQFALIVNGEVLMSTTHFIP